MKATFEGFEVEQPKNPMVFGNGGRGHGFKQFFQVVPPMVVEKETWEEDPENEDGPMVSPTVKVEVQFFCVSRNRWDKEEVIAFPCDMDGRLDCSTEIAWGRSFGQVLRSMGITKVEVM